MVNSVAKRFYTNPGTGIRTTYKLIYVDSSRSYELLETGKENFQEYIESFGDSCDIEVIARRVANGETNLLAAQIGSYGDFTGLPDSLQELMNTARDAHRVYDGLPVDVKSKFSDFNDFAQNAGNEEWLTKLGYDIPAVEPISVDPPSKPESEVSE